MSSNRQKGDSSAGVSTDDISVIGGDGAARGARQRTVDRLHRKMEEIDEELEEEKQSRAKVERRLDDLLKGLRKHDLDPNDVAEGVVPEGKVKKVKGKAVNPPRIEWRDMPMKVLPDPVAGYARAIRKADDLDESLFSVPALSVLGAAIGNSAHFELRPGWTEVPTVWTCPLLPSGCGKSHVLEKALAPAKGQDKEAHEEYTEKLADWKGKDPGERDRRPQREHYTLNDTTAETAGLRHGENPRGLLLYRDELAGFIGGMDQYKQGDSDLQTWIEMYDGNAVKIDRKSSDPSTLYIPSPAVTITGTMQPEVMREKMQPRHFQSGFAQRLWMVKPPMYQHEWTTAGIQPKVKRRYHNLVDALYELPYDSEDGPRTVRMSKGAENRWADWYNDCAVLKDSLVSNPLRSMVAKSEALTARIALILHLCKVVDSDGAPREVEDSTISERTMLAAMDLGEWFQREAARIYQMNGFAERGVSRDTANARQLPEEFAWDDVADVWDVSKQGAYNVIERLTGQGLIEKTDHGVYTSCVGDGPKDDYEHWAT